MKGLLINTDGSGRVVELPDQEALEAYYELLDCKLVEIVGVYGRDDAFIVSDEEAKLVMREVEVPDEDEETQHRPGLAPNKYATELVYGPGDVEERRARQEAVFEKFREQGFEVINPGSPGEADMEPYVAGDVVVIGRKADCPVEIVDWLAAKGALGE